MPQDIKQFARERILILDGAIGTVLMGHALREEDVRGEEFADHEVPLKDNLDLLNLTRPELVETVHRAYLNAGADIITTNTFMSNRLVQSRYELTDHIARLNREAAILARRVVDDFIAYEPDRSIIILGSVGPTDAVPDTADDATLPKWRRIAADEFRHAAAEQAEALIRGGVDMIALETVPSVAHAVALCESVQTAAVAVGSEIPLWLSLTVDTTGERLHSGESIESALDATQQYSPAVIGINCSFGFDSVRRAVPRLADRVTGPIGAYPSAGLPEENGLYPHSPADLAEWSREIAESGLINIIGGCCGTTPEHIRALTLAIRDVAPRPLP